LTSSQSAVIERVGHPEDAGAEGNVVVDRLRERVRLLEDHADPLPHFDRIDVGAVEILAVVEDRALHAGGRDQVVHAVEATDERALAAARRADEGRHEVLVDLERDLLEGLVPRVRDTEVVDVEDDIA
jgi:hypothetical protein